MEHFQVVNFSCDVVHAIAFGQWCGVLCDDFTAVAYVAYPVYCYSAFFLTRSLYGFMYMTAIHAFASEFRKQCRMDVHHAVVICLYKKIGNHEKKACKYDEVDVVAVQCFHQNGFIVEFAFRYHHCWNIVSGGTGEGIRVCTV